ncbi:MAG: Single-stranded DNA-binding protein [Microgenomates group bacterium GW2011_GWA1_48_10]|nr:MAG: Single-stranded DNA-binding protein [Microgenomates group bacterium GW2011_GWA1_48_10]
MLIGNVTRDPELRYTPQGNAVCTVGLATNRSWKTESGEMREEAEFHRLVAWNKLAELCSQLLTKGRKIYVEGRLQTRTFTGSDNAQHTITEIVIDDMILLDSKFAGGGASGGSYGPSVAYGAGSAAAQAPATSPESATASGAAASSPAATDDQGGAQGGKGKKKSEKPEENPAEAASEAGGEDVNIDDIPF